MPEILEAITGTENLTASPTTFAPPSINDGITRRADRFRRYRVRERGRLPIQRYRRFRASSARARRYRWMLAEPLNYFIYPYAEVDGRPHEPVEQRFFFRDLPERSRSGDSSRPATPSGA